MDVSDQTPPDVRDLPAWPAAEPPRAESAESAESRDLQERTPTGTVAYSAESAESAARAQLAPRVPLALERRTGLPVFPTAALPRWCGDMVAAVAESMQVPEDSPGTVLLGALSTAAGGRAVVRPRPDWTEPVNLYVLVTAGSSERKSPVLREMRQPLHLAQTELIEAARPKVEEALLLQKVAQQRAEAAARDAARDTVDPGKKLADAVGAAALLSGIEVPPMPRLLAGGDATPEAIVMLLAQHGGRMAVWDAEGGIFDRLAGMYSNGVSNLDNVLKAFSGEPISVDRRGRPAESVERPALSLVLMVQPTTLARLSSDSDMVGRGLTARFLYSQPVSLVGHRKTGRNVPSIPAEVRQAYTDQLVELTTGLAGWTDPAALLLAEDALDVLDAHEEQTERRLGPAGDLAPTGSWGGKHDGRTIRIAGLLHLAHLGPVKGPRSAIAGDVMKDAVTLADYYAQHGRAALSPAPAGADLARAVLDHCRRNRLEAFTVRQLTTELPRGRFPNADVVRDAVEELESRHWIAEVEPPAKRTAGRRPSPRYVVHPDALREAP